MSNKQSFLKGATILGAAGILIKILGAAFKIPLGNLIGADGMAYFMAPYPIYNWLLVVATAGIPTAIARLVAEKEVAGDYKGVFRVVSVIVKPMVIIATIFFFVLFLGAPYIAKAVGLPGSEYAFKTIAPALLFVPLMAIFRGFFQGIQKLQAFAFSQIIEQIFRVVIGLGLAYYLFDKGVKYAAAGATFGAAIGAFFALFFVFALFLFIKKKRYIEKLENQSLEFEEKDRDILKKLLVIAIPITIGASIMPTMNSIDLILVVNRLTATGVGNAKELYGILTGFSVTIVNFPQILTASLQISLVPAITQLYVTYEKSGLKRDKKHLSDTVASGIKTSLIIGLPCAVGLVVLAEPIMTLLYSNQYADAIIGADILKYLAWDLIFLALYQSTTGILQGLRLQTLPAIHLGVGLIFKVVLTYTLVGIPSIGIVGAALSTVAAFGVASLLNVWALRKRKFLKLSLLKIMIKPTIAAFLMGLSVWFAYGPLESLVGHKLATVLAIVIGILVYGLMLLKTKTLSSEEYDLLPGGSKLRKIAEKLG